MTVEILEYHELEKLHYKSKISSRKNDTTVPKLQRSLDSMKQFKNQICKIIVEEQS
jgi:hypothetical protein